MAKINGGYYIKARIIQDSEISQSPPHFREIWDWLLKEANHQDVRVAGKIIKRGQCVRSYKEILNGLKWKVGYRTERYSRGQCESSMKFLRSRGMITTTRTTRGMIITICNYSYYQNQKNYENHTESDNETDSSTRQHDTINKNEKNVNNERKEITAFYTTKKNKKLSGNKYYWFNNFWKAFNYKKGKAEAADAWLEISGLDVNLQKIIISSAKSEAENRNKLLDDGKIPKMAQGWLSGKRWEDEIVADGYIISENWEHIP